MADLTDVQSAIVAKIAQALYPNGTAQASAVGAACKVFPGWPVAASLDADMSGGAVNVSVFALAMSRAVPQMPAQWQTVSITATDLAAAVSGLTITLSGIVTTPQAVTVVQGSQAWSYQVQSTDTLTSICTGLAALIPSATSTGATLTLAAGDTPVVRFAEPASVIQEVGRQQQVFQVSVWAPTPALRAQVASLIDPQIRLGYRLTMPDTTAAEVKFQGSADDDMLDKRNTFVRHLRYEAEYATTITQTTTTVTAPVVTVSANVTAI